MLVWKQMVAGVLITGVYQTAQEFWTRDEFGQQIIARAEPFNMYYNPDEDRTYQTATDAAFAYIQKHLIRG